MVDGVTGCRASVAEDSAAGLREAQAKVAEARGLGLSSKVRHEIGGLPKSETWHKTWQIKNSEEHRNKVNHASATLVPVAQLDRALASEAKGRWFDPSRVHQKETPALTRRGGCLLSARLV